MRKTKMDNKTRILIADDHLVVRMGLAAIIGIEKDMTVVGEACDGREAVRLAATLRPDVIVMDLMMPKLGGTDATEAILKANPSAKILILTTFGTSDELRRALDAGAVGALVKDSAHGQLIDAIRHAASGELTIHPEILRQLKASEQKPELSPRQIEILTFVSKGLSNADIAEVIGIGRDCVKAHLKTAFSRLGASSRAEAVSIALKNRLLKI